MRDDSFQCNLQKEHWDMMDQRAEKLATFIRSNLMQTPDAPLDLDTSLVDNGSLDSMGATLLAAFVEEQFGARLHDSELTAEHIGTIRKVLTLIDASRGNSDVETQSLQG